MHRAILNLIPVLGAFVCWIFKGFKGTFDDQYDDKNYNINLGIGIVSLFISIGSIAFFSTFGK